jgi:iron complex outermembrane receptor protein/hemoglobin/transferrin/lactoferrin receptor protein
VGTASRVSLRHERKGTAAVIGFTYYQAGAVRPGGGLRSPDPASYPGLERAPGEPYRPVLRRDQVGTDFEFYAADATLLQRLGRGTDVVLKGQYAVRPELVRYDQVTPRFKETVPARAERSLRPMTRAMASATLRHRRVTGWLDSAEVQIAWQRIQERRVDRRLAETCLDATQDPETCTGRLTLTADSARSFEENASNAFTLRAEARSATPTRALSAIAGVDFHHDIVSSAGETLDLETLATTPDESRYPDGSTVSEAALFGHVRVRPLPRFHLFAGARGGLFLVSIAGRSGVAGSGFQRTVGDGVGSLGAHWELEQGLAWVANGARGVRAPNVEDFAALGTRAQGRFQVPNAHVRPEHSYTVDSGLKLARGAHRAHIMGFFTRYADAIVLAPTTVGGLPSTADGDAYFHSVNASFTDYFGIESGFDVTLARLVQIFGRALVMQGSQYNAPRTNLPAETPADRAPPVQGELGVRVSLLPSFSLEAFAVGRAPQRRLNDPINREDNRIPEGGTPGYVTLHSRLKYVADRHLVARLALDNIADALALDHGSGFYRSGFAVTGSVELVFGHER